jgi:hypothetical protein
MRAQVLAVALLLVAACKGGPADSDAPTTGEPAQAALEATGSGATSVEPSRDQVDESEEGGLAVEEAREALLECTLDGAWFGRDSEFGEIDDLAWAHDHLYIRDDDRPRLSRYVLETSDGSCTLTLDTSFGTDGWLEPGSQDTLAVLGDRLLGSGRTTSVWLLDGAGSLEQCGGYERGRISVGPDGTPLSTGGHHTVQRLDVENGCELVPVPLPEGLGDVYLATTTSFGTVVVDGQVNSAGNLTHVIHAISADGASELWRVGSLEEGPDYLMQVMFLEADRNGVAYVASRDRNLVVLNAEGQPTQRIDLTAIDGSLPVPRALSRGPDGRVFVAISARSTLERIANTERVFLSRAPLFE